jgi:uncharacterized protein
MIGATSRSLRGWLAAMAFVLVGAGVVIQRVDVSAAPSPATSTTTTVTSSVPSTVATTTTTLLAPGVIATAPRGARQPSHCPLTMATAPVRTTTALNLAPRRCTILEIGDSLGNDLGWGLRRQLGGYPWLTLVQEDKSSSGLANAWFFSWPAHLATDLRRYHPHVVLVMLGGNDQQSYYVKGVYEAVGTPAWRATYRHFVRQIVDIACAAGAQVLWVGLPVMQPSFYSQGAAMLNAQYAAAIARVPGAAYLPTWRLFAGADGSYRASASVNGAAQTLRSPDGIHFSLVGENVLSTYVVDQMSVLFHLPLRAAQPARITGP